MPYSLIVDKKQPVDREWYHQLIQATRGLDEVYNLLGPTEPELRQLQTDFARSNYSAKPQLYPSAASAQAYHPADTALRQLKKNIRLTEKNESIARAYELRIDELLAHHELLTVACRHDSAGFKSKNESMYGKPDEKVFAAVCAWLRQQAGQCDVHAAEDTHAIQLVLEVIPDLAGNPSLIIPPDKTFATVRAAHFAPGGYVDQLFHKVNLPGIVDASHGERALEQLLKNIGSDYQLMDTEVFWGVSHSNHAVYRPEQYRLSRQEFQGVIAHEIGSHLLESVNGSRQPLQLLAAGLDRYEHGNEGRAYLREQLMYETPQSALREPSWEHIITMHLAISLAYGLYDHPYTFSEVYHVIYAVGLLMKRLRKNRSPDANASQYAHEQAWVTTTRVLKGTAGTGGAYHKDIVYLEGNLRCWQLAVSNPEFILYGDLGKFDITRRAHWKLLQKFGILPTNFKLDYF